MPRNLPEVVLANQGSLGELLREAKRLSKDNGIPVTFWTPAGTKAVVRYIRRKSCFKFAFVPKGRRPPVVRQLR